jgi:DNA-binding Lrp family transcriptional regulator
MNALDEAIVRATQGGLPLVKAPYSELAAALGITEEALVERLRAMLADGRIRRIGAVPNHYRLGYRANAMSVWNVDDSEVDRLGRVVGELPFVCHCYRRPRRRPHWPYNLFAMVHGRDRAETGGHVAAIGRTLGAACRGCDVLYSTRILKKTGLRLA